MAAPTPVGTPAAPPVARVPQPALPQVTTYELTCNDWGLIYAQTVFIDHAAQPWASVTIENKREGWTDDPSGALIASGQYVAGDVVAGGTFVNIGPSANDTTYVFSGASLTAMTLHRGKSAPVNCQ